MNIVNWLVVTRMCSYTNPLTCTAEKAHETPYNDVPNDRNLTADDNATKHESEDEVVTYHVAGMNKTLPPPRPLLQLPLLPRRRSSRRSPRPETRREPIIPWASCEDPINGNCRHREGTVVRPLPGPHARHRLDRPTPLGSGSYPCGRPCPKACWARAAQ